MQRLRTPKEAAAYLAQRGLKTAESTLGKLRVIGGGPRFHKWGRQPLYDETDLAEWAEQRLGTPRRSTSEVHRVDRDAAPTNPMKAEPLDLIVYNDGSPLDGRSAVPHAQYEHAVRAPRVASKKEPHAYRQKQSAVHRVTR